MIDIIITQLTNHEGLRLMPYRCPAGRLSIGFGRNLEEKGITEAEAIMLLKNDIKECLADLATILPDFDDLPEPVQMALVDMRFNLGPGRFRSFKKMIAAVKAHDFQRAAAEMHSSCWYTQVGRRASALIDIMEQADAAPNTRSNGNNKKFRLPQIPETRNPIPNIQHSPYSLVATENIGPNTRIWSFTNILAGAVIGADCNICDHVFIENDVRLGDRVTVKCGVQLWDGMRVEDDVFIGPNATFTNDIFPRSKQYPEKFQQTILRKGCSIGANATILCGIEIGENAMVGAGAVVTKSVPPNAVVWGNPAVIQRYIK